ncbi:MAG: replicative DNA helicase [Weeksellaceae bacterium]
MSEFNKDIELERKVIGEILIDSKQLSLHYFKLSEDLFYEQKHKTIYCAIRNLFENNEPVDLSTIDRELQKNKNKNLISYLIECTSMVASSAHLEHHIFILVELAAKRDFASKFYTLSSIARNPESNIFELRDKALEYFDNIFLERFIEKTKEQRHFPELIDSVHQNIKQITNGVKVGLFSSLDLINKIFGGWQKSELTIVAGRPGMGKTAFLVQCAIDQAIQNNSVGIISLEMSAEQLTSRFISNYTEIPNSSILRKGLNETEILEFMKYKTAMQELPLHIIDTPGLSIQDIRMKSKILKLKYNIEILFIDYLQLSSDPIKNKNREQEISSITMGLKNIAKELNISVIALSQLSRAVENRIDKRPILSDLRDSGSIEQTADGVIFLFRPEYYGIQNWGEEYDFEPTKNEIELIIAKNRNGAIHHERCAVNLPISQFSNLKKFNNEKLQRN